MSQNKKNQKDDHASLLKYSENLTKSRPETPNCEKILGFPHKVGEFGAFFREHAGDIDLVVSYLLMEYAKTQDFTPEVYAAYRLGLSEVPAFMDRCFKEVVKKSQNKLDEI